VHATEVNRSFHFFTHYFKELDKPEAIGSTFGGYLGEGQGCVPFGGDRESKITHGVVEGTCGVDEEDIGHQKEKVD